MARTFDEHFHINQPAQAVGDSGDVAVELVGIADDGDVGFQIVLSRSQKVFQIIAANLFFAFDQHDEIDGNSAVLLPGGDGLDMGPDLAFVIHRAAGKDRIGAGVGFSQRRFEGWSDPLLHWLRRLDIIVPVKQHRFSPRLVLVFGQHDWMSLSRFDFHIQFRLAQFPRQPLGAALKVLGVLGLGADAGDAEKILQARQRCGLA